MFSAVGPDPIGDFITNKLKLEGVDTTHVKSIDGTTSTAVVCGIQPPDTFPLVFYRDNAPDNKITIDHVNQVEFSEYKSFLMTGTALSVEPTRSAAFYASEKAKQNKLPIFLDVDFRANLWHDVRAFGTTIRQYLKYANVVIGTEEELLAMYLSTEDQVKIKDSSISAPTIEGDIKMAIRSILEEGVELLLVKTGPQGVMAYHKDGTSTSVSGFPVDVVNVLGAGDAFAGGFIYGYINGWDLYKSLRLANACGAWLVTKQGCSNYAPYFDEITQFIESKGGY